jgi:hypothetical protein
VRILNEIGLALFYVIPTLEAVLSLTFAGLREFNNNQILFDLFFASGRIKSFKNNVLEDSFWARLCDGAL